MILKNERAAIATVGMAESGTVSSYQHCLICALASCSDSLSLPRQQHIQSEQQNQHKLELPQPAPAEPQANISAVVDPKQQQQQQLQATQQLPASHATEPANCHSAVSMLQQKYKFLQHLGGGAFGAVVQASTGRFGLTLVGLCACELGFQFESVVCNARNHSTALRPLHS
jgi:hypothetical protein